MPIEDRQITLDEYRFGYQGQFAERDNETGWNHFELREYDAVIGRWLVIDPMRQHWSPYIAMSNNPVYMVDPNGGSDGPGDECTECAGMGVMYSGPDIVIESTNWDDIVDFFATAEFVSDVDLKVDIGIAAKLRGNFWGLKGEADLNVVLTGAIII